LVGKAEDIFTANDDQPLAEELTLRRRFIDGYHYLRMRDPARLARLEAAIRQFEAELRRAKLNVHELRPHIDGGRLFRVLVLLPLAIAGATISYPTYRLVGFLADRLSKGEQNVLATMKFLGALLLYPLTYLALAIFAGVRWGWIYCLAAGLLLPFLGYIALWVFEAIDDVTGDVRALTHRLFRRYGHTRLLAQREAIRREMIAVAKEMT
jgi:glycerol-3-phosphate O-acyltransferase/dihydroxyacetone phosphate acyltransferase